jgi:trimethylamine--corrinoid protein Co-methyltransferase
MFVNTMPRYEILSADSIAVLDRGWRRIVSEIGIQFAKPEAVELFAKAGQDGRRDGQARPGVRPGAGGQGAARVRRAGPQPGHNVHIGGDHMVFSSVYGCPFVREGDVRRDATMNDFRQLCSLSQAYASSTRPAG